MALPTFDATKHHIGLRASGAGTTYGFMLDGGYVKEVQRESLNSGGREFGGATDLTGQTPSLSRWTQDDFVGGMFAYNWGRDDAMFADSTGFMPDQQGRSIISCPPIHLKYALDAGSTIKSMFMVAGYIYIVTATTIHRYHIDTHTYSSTGPPTDGSFVSAEYESTDQMIWAFCNSSASGDRPMVMRYKTDLSLPAYDFIFQGPNNTADHRLIGGTIFNEFVVAQIGRRLYRGDPPDKPDPTLSTTMKWYRGKRLPGRWRDSLAYNNTLYILINDGSYKSHIFAYDGDTATPIVEFPFAFYAKAMTEYAGRIFVVGTGTDVNGNEQYAELYEVTGASVRLVRSFSPETRNYFVNNITAGWATTFDDVIVNEGLLWLCHKGRKLIAYDVTSDGFFGASEILGDTTLNFKKFTAGRGRIWGYATGAQNGIYRIAQPVDGALDEWHPELVTSDFTYEIAMLKRWSEIQVMTRYGAVSSLEYSIDSGESWTAVSFTSSATGAGSKVYFTKGDLSAIPSSKIIRFRIKLDSTGGIGSAVTYHRELVAYTVAFSMANETKKKAWGLTINGSTFIETRDAEFLEATTQQYVPEEVRDQLWSWANAETNLVLKDLDGEEYNVKIEAIREVMPVIGPNVGDEPEAHFSLTLLQV